MTVFHRISTFNKDTQCYLNSFVPCLEERLTATHSFDLYFCTAPFAQPPLLAWALTGDATKTDVVRAITRKAYVTGYARYTVLGKDYPAVVKKHNDNATEDEDARVQGLLLTPQNRSQRAKLDDFEGEAYKMEPVTVTVMTTDDQGGDDDTERVEADMYLWDGDPEDISQEGWDLVTFERERLDDWLELFGGMELVGQEDSDDGHS